MKRNLGKKFIKGKGITFTLPPGQVLVGGTIKIVKKPKDISKGKRKMAKEKEEL